MSESVSRLALAIGFAILALLGVVWLFTYFGDGMTPLNGAFWWFALFLFGLGYAAFCLFRSVPLRP